MPSADRSVIARQAAAGLRTFAAQAASTPVLIGFDGFVDSIIEVVDKRQDARRYTAVPTIARFAEKIAAAAGQSSNYELVTTLQKLGGNGPIMANAMAAAGVGVSYIGAVGHPAIHPVFEELAKIAEVYSVAQPGFTDALEFTDGKLMMGKYGTISDLGWATVEAAMGADLFHRVVTRSRLIGMVNWTMLDSIESVWEEIYTALGNRSGEKPFIFIDLADPEKRTDEDLRRAMAWATRLNERARVILGLNLKESVQCAACVGLPAAPDAKAAIRETATALRAKLGIHAVVIHPREGAAAAVETPSGVETAEFLGPFTQKPRLSTGAGDNFNAGFCLGQLAGLPVDQCLCVGTATSGFYVRNARSPQIGELAAFCDDLPPSE